MADAHGAAAEEPAVQVDGLRVVSRIGGRENTLVSNLSFALGRGRTLGIVGESGSGKSMTARAMLGLLPPGVTATGSVRLKGRELLGLDERALRRLRGRQVGLVFQDPFTMLNPLLKCGRQITETLTDANGKRLRGAGERDEAIKRLGEVGIVDPGVADRYPFELSGGMRQRVGIAAALARDPEVLIAGATSTIVREQS